MLHTASHELVHHIRDWSPEKYKILADFLMEQYGKKGVSVDALVNRQIEKAKAKGRTLTYAEAHEEVIADSMETMFDDGKVLEKLQMLKAKDKTLYEKIKAWISELVDKIKKAYKDVQPETIEGEIVASMLDEIETIQQLFVDAIVDASENFKNAEVDSSENVKQSDIKYSQRENSLEKEDTSWYDKHNPLSFDNRASVNSKSSINWVYKAGIFSQVENKLFHQMISEINQGSNAFVKNSAGEYMLPIENKIVFTDGNYDYPYIREIVEVLTNSSTLFEEIRKVIFDVESGRTRYREAVRLIEISFGKERIIFFKNNDNRAYGWTDRKRKGANRRAVIERYQRLQDRRGNDRESNETSLKLSDRDPNALTPRNLLANALESSAVHEVEKKKLAEYKDNIEKLYEKEQELYEVRKEIKELSFAPGKRDTAKLKKLQKKAIGLSNSVTFYDKKLLNLESTSFLKNVLEREKSKAIKRQKEKDAEILKRQKEKALQKEKDIADRYKESRKKSVESRNRTAGEIEARDSAARSWRTDEARKEKRPDIDRTDVVFADGGASYDQDYQDTETNNELVSLIQKVRENDYKDNDKVELGAISERAAKEIKRILGIDVSGYKIVIEARQIHHILKDHGENGKSDHSMADDIDIAKMEYAFNSYDKISYGGKTHAYKNMINGYNRPTKTILYEKEIGDNSYYVVQAIPETKHKKVYIVTAFIGKKGYKKEASQFINAKSPDVTSVSETAKTSNTSIPDFTENVKTNDVKLSDRDPNALTPRNLLANALESSAVHEVEKKKLAEYNG